MTELVYDAAPQAADAPAPKRSRRPSLSSRFRKVEWYFDQSETSQSKGAKRIRLAFGTIFLAYAIILEVTAARHGDVSVAPIFIAIGATPLLMNRFGRFAYYFVPVFLGLFSYIIAAQFAEKLKLSVHYTPQLRIEEYLTPGPIPTVWLQEHLYHGHTGYLETFAVVMYASHFLVPLLLGFGLAMTDRGKAFGLLMFGILGVSMLGEATFILAPTAPPWLAAQEGYIPHLHHILKQSLYDLHMTKLAQLDGDSSKYNITAAVPSLHVAFPVICVLTARKFGLSKWIVGALVANTLAVIFAIVYTGEHYVFDALVGLLYAVVAWVLVCRLMGRDAHDEVPPTRPAPRRGVLSVPGRRPEASKVEL